MWVGDGARQKDYCLDLENKVIGAKGSSQVRKGWVKPRRESGGAQARMLAEALASRDSIELLGTRFSFEALGIPRFIRIISN